MQLCGRSPPLRIGAIGGARITSICGASKDAIPNADDFFFACGKRTPSGKGGGIRHGATADIQVRICDPIVVIRLACEGGEDTISVGVVDVFVVGGWGRGFWGGDVISA